MKTCQTTGLRERFLQRGRVEPTAAEEAFLAGYVLIGVNPESNLELIQMELVDQSVLMGNSW